MGHCLHSLLWLLPLGGVPRILLLGNGSHLGECGRRQSHGPSDDPDPPQEVQVRPGGGRLRHRGWSHWDGALPRDSTPHLHRAQRNQPGALFLDSAERPAAKPWFMEQIHGVFSILGVPHRQYAGHSFRIGAATAAALAGVEDSMIQTLGRWQSSAFLQYIRTPKERLAAISRTLAASSSAQVPGQTGSS